MSIAVVKNAAITTASVLVILWLLNQTPAKPYVQKALTGA